MFCNIFVRIGKACRAQPGYVSSFFEGFRSEIETNEKISIRIRFDPIQKPSFDYVSISVSDIIFAMLEIDF